MSLMTEYPTVVGRLIRRRQPWHRTTSQAWRHQHDEPTATHRPQFHLRQKLVEAGESFQEGRTTDVEPIRNPANYRIPEEET